MLSPYCADEERGHPVNQKDIFYASIRSLFKQALLYWWPSMPTLLPTCSTSSFKAMARIACPCSHFLLGRLVTTATPMSKICWCYYYYCSSLRLIIFFFFLKDLPQSPSSLESCNYISFHFSYFYDSPFALIVSSFFLTEYSRKI